MTQDLTHCSPEEIQSRIDGRLSPEELSRVDAHLAICPACARALEVFSRLDKTLRSFPLVRADASFTRAVMSRLPLRSAASRYFRVLIALPYVLALGLVVGTMLIAFFWSGALSGADVAATESFVDQGLDLIGGGVKTVAAGAVKWVEPLLTQHALNGSAWTVVSVCAVLVLLLLLDRVVLRRLFRGGAA
jgi:anti-sigma factor RsiW